LGERVAWHWGFAAAGIGMLVGLVVYTSGLRLLPAEPRKMRGAKRETARLTPHDGRTLFILIGLMPVIAVAMIGNMEIFNGYLLWGKANFQLDLFGQIMPVSWLLSIDAFVSVFTIGASMAFWRWWAGRWREPDEIVKVALGAVILAAAPLILAAASVQAGHGHKAGLVWGLGFHIVNDIGFANAYAVGLALYSRAAPRGLGATVVNLFSLAIFFSNLIVGRLAGLLTTMSGAAFWLLHAGLILGAAIVLLIAARLFRRQLAPRSEAEQEGFAA